MVKACHCSASSHPWTNLDDTPRRHLKQEVIFEAQNPFAMLQFPFPEASIGNHGSKNIRTDGITVSCQALNSLETPDQIVHVRIGKILEDDFGVLGKSEGRAKSACSAIWEGGIQRPVSVVLGHNTSLGLVKWAILLVPGYWLSDTDASMELGPVFT